MSAQLVLTYAEIQFLLRSYEPEHVAVREQLGLPDGPDAERNAAAGLASLLARGLCARDADRVVPSNELVGVIGALSAATRGTDVLGRRAGGPVLLHLFTGPRFGIAVQPVGLGQYAVTPLDPARDLSDQVVGFVDACLAGTRDTAVVVRSGVVRAAVATSATGEWYISDSVNNPNQGHPCTPADAAARIRAVLAVPV
ncbi:hypothetical protein [Actinophytocola sp.]|uniref:hypothetical protein n=1 Tax=Actinophytocola sp. TaxID=1872138 RepID=UPI002ED49E92